MRSLSDLLESDYNWWVAHAARRTTCAASPTCSSQTTTGEWHTPHGALHAQPLRPARVRLQLVSGTRRTAHYMRSLSDLLESDYNWWVAHAARRTTCAASQTCSSQTTTGEWHTPHGALHAQPLRPARVRLQLVSGVLRHGADITTVIIKNVLWPSVWYFLLKSPIGMLLSFWLFMPVG